MFAIKRELKLNNKERSLMRGIAGFKRFVYNYALSLGLGKFFGAEMSRFNVTVISLLKGFAD
jgi:Helix-turn-helix domain